MKKFARELKSKGYLSAMAVYDMIYEVANDVAEAKMLKKQLPEDVPFVVYGTGRGARKYYLVTDVEEWLDGLSHVEEKPW